MIPGSVFVKINAVGASGADSCVTLATLQSTTSNAAETSETCTGTDQICHAFGSDVAPVFGTSGWEVKGCYTNNVEIKGLYSDSSCTSALASSAYYWCQYNDCNTSINTTCSVGVTGAAISYEDASSTCQVYNADTPADTVCGFGQDICVTAVYGAAAGDVVNNMCGTKALLPTYAYAGMQYFASTDCTLPRLPSVFYCANSSANTVCTPAVVQSSSDTPSNYSCSPAASAVTNGGSLYSMDAAMNCVNLDGMTKNWGGITNATMLNYAQTNNVSQYCFILGNSNFNIKGAVTDQTYMSYLNDKNFTLYTNDACTTVASPFLCNDSTDCNDFANAGNICGRQLTKTGSATLLTELYSQDATNSSASCDAVTDFTFPTTTLPYQTEYCSGNNICGGIGYTGTDSYLYSSCVGNTFTGSGLKFFSDNACANELTTSVWGLCDWQECNNPQPVSTGLTCHSNITSNESTSFYYWDNTLNCVEIDTLADSTETCGFGTNTCLSIQYGSSFVYNGCGNLSNMQPFWFDNTGTKGSFNQMRSLYTNNVCTTNADLQATFYECSGTNNCNDSSNLETVPATGVYLANDNDASFSCYTGNVWDNSINTYSIYHENTETGTCTDVSSYYGATSTPATGTCTMTGLGRQCAIMGVDADHYVSGCSNSIVEAQTTAGSSYELYYDNACTMPIEVWWCTSDNCNDYDAFSKAVWSLLKKALTALLWLILGPLIVFFICCCCCIYCFCCRGSSRRSSSEGKRRRGEFSHSSSSGSHKKKKKKKSHSDSSEKKKKKKKKSHSSS